ncbi:LysR family transcriptional regulator [Streptomyces sp. NPDC094049]|uniref:LysR family transcriptional regulator n=1 Tax=Streptomyces sp. NPDC094049 TaxID=3154987 RepID=UPI0033254DE9
MELRRSRYFLAVAEELDVGRAAARPLVAGPSPSQRIKALEWDPGVVPLDRARRSVALTVAGTALPPHVRSLLERTDDLKVREGRLSGSRPVRLGHVGFSFTDRPTLTVSLGILLQRTDRDWAIAHYRVSRPE